ncbi:hypothetical protein JHK85_050212 [Glycine max]|nr:hypothetical protein JHK85_050212 [Glycine max]
MDTLSWSGILACCQNLRADDIGVDTAIGDGDFAVTSSRHSEWRLGLACFEGIAEGGQLRDAGYGNSFKARSSRNTHWRDLPVHSLHARKAKSPLKVVRTCHSKIAISNDGIYTDIADSTGDLSLLFLSHSNSNNSPQYSGDGEEAAAVGPVVSASEAANHSRPLGSPAAGAAPPSSQQQGLWFFLRFHNAPRVHTLAHLLQTCPSFIFSLISSSSTQI